MRFPKLSGGKCCEFNKWLTEFFKYTSSDMLPSGEEIYLLFLLILVVEMMLL